MDSTVAAKYQLCSKCEGNKIIYESYPYGYVGAYTGWTEHECPRCGGTGIELKPENSDKILKKLLEEKNESDNTM